MWQPVEGDGKGQNERGRIKQALRRDGLQGRYSFLRFFRPPEECKNPHWSDLKQRGKSDLIDFTLFKGQMQRNLDNFCFVENPV